MTATKRQIGLADVPNAVCWT